MSVGREAKSNVRVVALHVAGNALQDLGDYLIRWREEGTLEGARITTTAEHA